MNKQIGVSKIQNNQAQDVNSKAELDSTTCQQRGDTEPSCHETWTFPPWLARVLLVNDGNVVTVITNHHTNHDHYYITIMIVDYNFDDSYVIAL